MTITDTITINREKQSDFVTIVVAPTPGSIYSDQPGWKERRARKQRKWTEDATVTLEINAEALFRLLGGKAVGNKTGKSSAMHGIIKAKVTRRSERNVQETDLPIPEGYEVVA